MRQKSHLVVLVLIIESRGTLDYANRRIGLEQSQLLEVTVTLRIVFVH